MLKYLVFIGMVCFFNSCSVDKGSVDILLDTSSTSSTTNDTSSSSSSTSSSTSSSSTTTQSSTSSSTTTNTDDTNVQPINNDIPQDDGAPPEIPDFNLNV